MKNQPRICKVCSIVLTINENISITQLNKSDYKCKECRKKYVTQHYIKNKQKYIKNSKKWKNSNVDLDKKLRKTHYNNNKNLYKKRVEKWIKDNPERNKEYKKNWQKEKLKDPLEKLKAAMRKHIYKGVKNTQSLKKCSSLEIVGLESWADLKKHIESKFQEGMNWSNWGVSKNNLTWHIDHIIPLYIAKDINDVIKLNHHTNLQPMWSSDNIRKSNHHETQIK